MATSSSSERTYESLRIEETHVYDTKYFFIPPHYEGTLDKVLLPYGMIKDRVEQLAKDILDEYAKDERTIHLLCVLKGSTNFFQDLITAMRKLHAYSGRSYIPFVFDFVRVKSYEGMESSGRVTISGIDATTLRGKHVMFVEDIVDTGLTMTRLMEYLPEFEPASVKVVTLLEKRTTRNNGYQADYAGFSIPDVFVIGYGLDYDEAYRELDPICIINSHGIEKFAGYDKK